MNFIETRCRASPGLSMSMEGNVSLRRYGLIGAW